MTKLDLENKIREWLLDSPKHINRTAEVAKSLIAADEYIYKLKQLVVVGGVPIYLDHQFTTTTLGQSEEDINPDVDLIRLNRELKDFDEEFGVLLKEGLGTVIDNIVDQFNH